MAGAAGRRGGAGPRRGDAPGAAGLLALLLAGAALAFVLRELSGGPRAPDGAHIRDVLAGAELAGPDAAAAAAACGWLVLCYLALSVGLRLLVLAAGRISGGARWARAGLRVSTLVTVPAVRRLVDSGAGGALLAASWLPLPVIEGAGGAAHAAAAPSVLAAHADAGPYGASAEPSPVVPRLMLYTVAPGDDPWEIARRLYSDGSRFVEIVEANRGLVTPGGEHFTGPRLVRPGSTLRVPLPAHDADAGDAVISYRVRRGDHLWGIAERFLGDGFRWVEIWERNRGREVEPGVRLTDPDRLRPGWVLELPVRDAPAGTSWSGPWGAPAATEPGAPPAPPPEAPSPAGSQSPPVDRGGPSAEWPELPRPLLWTAAGFAVVGGAAVFVRRLARDGRLPLPGLGRDAGDGPGDAVRVTLAARSLSRALADCGFAEARPLLVQESGAGLAFTVECPVGDARALLARRHDLERRLDCGVVMEGSEADGLRLTLVGSRPSAGGLASQAGPPALVVPVGADDAGLVYLDLAACGAVTLAGSGSERRRMLRSWVATLASTHAPQELALRMDAATAGRLGEGPAAPHGGGSAAVTAAELVGELEELLASRASSGEHRPVLAIVSPGPGDAVALDGLQQDGPRAGLFIVRAVPVEEMPEGHGPRTARVVVGAHPDDADGGASGAAGGAAGTAIALTVGAGPPRHLEAVTVRRDTSARWAAGPEGGEPDSPAATPVDAGVGGTLPDLPVHAADGPVEPRHSDLDPEPDTGRDGWAWEAAVLGPAGDGDVPGGHPPPEEPAEDAPAPDEPEGAEPHAYGDPESRGRAEEGAALAAAGGDGVAGERLRGGEPRAAANGAAPPAPDPVEQPEEPVLPIGGGARATPIPPAPPAAAALPGGAADSPVPAARQPTLLTDREMSDLRVEVEEPGPVFHVRCLGPLRLSAHGAPADRWPLEKCRELLAFLAAQGPVSVAREVVAEALWPEFEWDASLKHTLSNTVGTLRGTLRTAASADGLQPLIAVRQRLQLQPSLFAVDLDAFDAAIRRAADLPPDEAIEEYERAIRLYEGEFLEGEFFTWLEPYRMDYRRRLLDAAREAAGIAEGMGAHLRAAPLHRAILEREPTDEDAARGLMRCLARSGDVVGARKTFKALSEALAEELGDARVRPSAETRALLAELSGAGAARG